MTVADYVATLKAQLPAGRAERDDLLEELCGHLEDCARDLQLQGLSAGQSEAEAVRRFGAAGEVAAALRAPAAGEGDQPARARRSGRAIALAALLAALLAATMGGGMAGASFGSTGHTTHRARAVPAVTRPAGAAHLATGSAEAGRGR